MLRRGMYQMKSDLSGSHLHWQVGDDEDRRKIGVSGMILKYYIRAAQISGEEPGYILFFQNISVGLVWNPQTPVDAYMCLQCAIFFFLKTLKDGA